MKRKDIDLENLESILCKIPKGTPWFYVLYGYIVATMRKNNGNRTHTSEQIKMPIRSLRYKLDAAEVLGFDVPPYKYVKKGEK